jgi:hypothetical protein
VAAAARLMAGMIGRAVDGLEGGDEAGHLKLRSGKKVGRLRSLVRSRQARKPCVRPATLTTPTSLLTAALGVSACADLRVTGPSGEERMRLGRRVPVSDFNALSQTSMAKNNFALPAMRPRRQ